MFGLGMGEIVVIAIVALLFLGPERLPSAAKSIGKTIRDLRRQTRELTSSIEEDSELGDAVREIRSALRDDPFYEPPPPRKPVSTETPTVAEGGLDAAVMAQLHAQPSDGASDSEAAHSEGGESDPALSDPDLPVIRPAVGAIARGRELDDASTAEGASATPAVPPVVPRAEAESKNGNG